MTIKTLIQTPQRKIKMRLLGWLHNKVRQNSNETFKDFRMGTTCFSSQSSDDDHYPDTKATEAESNFEDESSLTMPEIFHGFLSIGTLGSEQLTSEPPTPTLPMSLGDYIDESTEVTHNDLKLINEQLEKFLEAEAEEEGGNDSLARSSYVSIATLGGMQMEVASGDDYGKIICPLQGYLFGSSIELPETGTGSQKEKISLGELFRRTKITDEVRMENESKLEIKDKQAHSPKKLLKKLIKKFQGSPQSPIDHAGEADNFVPIKRKLNKVLKMFHRKVYPESSIAESNEKKVTKTGYTEDLKQQHIDNRKFCPSFKSVEGVVCFQDSLHQYGQEDSNSSRNRECSF